MSYQQVSVESVPECIDRDGVFKYEGELFEYRQVDGVIYLYDYDKAAKRRVFKMALSEIPVTK